MPDTNVTTDPYYDRLLAAQADPAAAAALSDPLLLERMAAQLIPDPGYVAPEAVVSEATVPGPHGDVPVRVYLPADPAGARPRPLFVWCHGGGWVGGDLDMPEADATAREVCARSGAAVVSVDYRLATAGVHYPVPVDDVLAAWTWALQECSSWGASPQRAVLGGASAGGNLAAGAALRLRDEGGPSPAALALVYPALHPGVAAFTEQQRQEHGLTEAAEELYRKAVLLMLENYAGAPVSEASRYIIPGTADPAGLPATLVVTCEYDVLRPSGEQFAQSLQTANIEHKLVMALGVGHAHINTPWLPAAQETYAALAEWVSQV